MPTDEFALTRPLHGSIHVQVFLATNSLDQPNVIDPRQQSRRLLHPESIEESPLETPRPDWQHERLKSFSMYDPSIAKAIAYSQVDQTEGMGLCSRLEMDFSVPFLAMNDLPMSGTKWAATFQIESFQNVVRVSLCKKRSQNRISYDKMGLN